jgi:hypothetical protein
LIVLARKSYFHGYVANYSRLPVVVVGSGFSRNAVIRKTNSIVDKEISLWDDLISELVEDLDIPTIINNPLRIAQLYYDHMGPDVLRNRLKGLINDDMMEPGRAHKALFNYPLEAVITTNQFDTLLDSPYSNWLKVLGDIDLSEFCGNSENKQLIYFHGHRSRPDDWVFTQNQYEDIYLTRPRIVTRVKQLFSMNPVLIVGYSLSDPDFHHIYRQISREMGAIQSTRISNSFK